MASATVTATIMLCERGLGLDLMRIAGKKRPHLTLNPVQMQEGPSACAEGPSVRSLTAYSCAIFRAPSFRLFPSERMGYREFKRNEIMRPETW